MQTEVRERFLSFGTESFVFQFAIQKNIEIKIYRTINSPVILYGCETMPFALKDEHRLRVFENRVLRGIFGPKRDDVTGKWRKLHNENIHDLYFSRNIVRVIKSRKMIPLGHVARNGERRGVYSFGGET
jgi:hypothetical protein